MKRFIARWIGQSSASPSTKPGIRRGVPTVIAYTCQVETRSDYDAIVSESQAFVARRCSFDRFDDFESIVLALNDQPDGLGDTVMLQRSTVDSPQDVALGHDTYCLVLPSGMTHYGGIDRSELAPERMALHFAAEAAAELGFATLDVELQLPDEEIVALHTGLEAILGPSAGAALGPLRRPPGCRR